MYTRRDFVRMAAGALVAGVAGNRLHARETLIGGVRVGAISYCFRSIPRPAAGDYMDTLIDAFKSVYAYMDKQGLKRTGPSMTIYTQADDTGFQFQAAVPIEAAPKDAPKGDIETGTSPGGRALKFVHRGSYDSMDTTYEAITNYLDEKRLEAQDLFVEEYATDPVTTPEDKFVVTVYVPIK